MPGPPIDDLGEGGPGRDVALTVRARVRADGRVTGSVARQGGAAVAFEGWLELLAALDDLLGVVAEERGTDRPATGGG
ncbi:MAG: hypothetical protein ACLGIO_04280 [Acidimicrobiia bacterium]